MKIKSLPQCGDGEEYLHQSAKARYLLVAPHLVAVPGIAIFLVVLCINLLGDQLRDALDVKGRQEIQSP